MLYLTSRWYSPNQFDFNQDPPLLQELVSKIERIDDVIWKIWTITDVFRAGPTESYVCNLEPNWQPAEVVAQNAPSYLQIEQNPGQTTFTIASASQSALQNLRALIANLYEPLRPAGLDQFLERNQDIPVRLVELFDRETGTKVRQTFVNPVSRRFISSQFPPPRWEVWNLSITPQINDPLPVLRLQIETEVNQAGFMISEAAQFLSRPDIIQAHNLFTLADMAFGGLVMPVLA